MNKSFLILLSFLCLVICTQQSKCSLENCESCDVLDDKCTKCKKSFYLSQDSRICKECSSNCEECTETKCLKCKDSYALDKLNMIQCQTQSQNRQLALDMFKYGCHYSCDTCIQTDSSSYCTTCPSSRYLQKYTGQEFGRCICSQETSVDNGEPQCSDGNVGIDSLNILSYLIQGLFIPSVVLTSIFGSNASFLYMLIETTQSYNILLYINSHNAGNLDSLLESFKFSHFDKFFPPIINQIYQHYWKQQPIDTNPKILYDHYNSDNTLTNNWMYFTIMALILITAFVLNKIQPSFSSDETSIIRWKKYLTFNIPFVYFFITFQSVFLQIIYTFACFNDSNHLARAGLAFSFLTFFFLIGISFILCFLYIKKIHQQKYYFLDLVFVSDSLSQRLFIIWTFLKKIIIAIVVVGMYKSPTGQAIIIFLAQIANSSYLYVFNPIQKQTKPTRRKIGICHESLSILVHLFFIIKQSIAVNYSFDMTIALLMLLDLLLLGIKGISISIRSIRKFLAEQFQKLQSEDIPTQQVASLPQLQDVANVSLNMTTLQKQQNTIMMMDKSIVNIDNNQNNKVFSI